MHGDAAANGTHRITMSSLQAREAELLVKVERARAAFRAASTHGQEGRQGNVRECLEPVARGYLNALHAFSALLLDGKETGAHLRATGQGSF